jgi:hypothetical protein
MVNDDALVPAAALTKESLANSAVSVEAVPMESLVPDETLPRFYSLLLLKARSTASKKSSINIATPMPTPVFAVAGWHLKYPVLRCGHRSKDQVRSS